ncbi:MAG: RNA polymerase-associated protein RapA [gamma proteobacterium endosymbiont of Lamellibrachia anaximandri]|nr:RNA polymerase-associated protein RapA [gamma proteobacterium endosymbiont of Lamellibrachia anaximandri]MBL3533143.1 RNA polymerase-associated protein RapA [gamma proteobacterium endosymbiont of Lamellibrachia anaximandri]
MIEFIPGQRWISDTESELGLGTVLKKEGRTVTLLFMAAGETRVYAMQNAPLTRVQFHTGDSVESHEGWKLHISGVTESDGLLTYRGVREDGSVAGLTEGELSNFTRFNKPQDRLLAGQIDPMNWFDLRYHTLKKLGQQEKSPTYGLSGARIDLIPHQLYIAHEVATRPAPRVLLADEVGLGKTIEACLILHHQLLTGRASRALILVPDPLVHQWLVELMRRFNLRFSILDEERCQAISESGQGDNPFHAEQLVLCSLNLFSQNPDRLSQALEGSWDLLIVDEAHHLAWSEDNPSAEYLLVESLALKTPGILLLTATPEQLGREGHFARLRLLDPDRYFDLAAFLEEEQSYRPVANAVEALLTDGDLSTESCDLLLNVLDDAEGTTLLQQLQDPATDSDHKTQARETLVELLLDRHGTGRVLFRNTRTRIEGFPERVLHACPLPLPEPYELPLAEPLSAAQRLTPERLYHGTGIKVWWRIDPRVDWIIRFLQENPAEKVLLICAHADTTIELQEALRQKTGIGAALFHEGMSILERDRGAAWFADPENGARILLCSEIGSEGRNFQFAHHLILFDLPLDPDLLEQRIGRLDRIGQTETVKIHVPYLDPGPQTVLLRWYHEGLDAFRHNVPGAHGILSQLRPVVTQALEEDDETEAQELLLETTRKLREETFERLRQGRDHLLELGGCREPMASELVATLYSQDQAPDLRNYMNRLFNSYGLESEELGLDSMIIRPGEQVLAGGFPGLLEEGMTLTYSRTTALAHEDRQLFTWEHPLVNSAMEMVIDQETGNSSAVGYKDNRIAAGQLLLEALYVVECIAPRSLQSGRFLPPTLIRVLVNDKGERLDHQISCNELTDQGKPLGSRTAAPVIRQFRNAIQKLVKLSEQKAQQQVPELIERAASEMMESYTSEIQRMVALKQYNPNVRDEEIEALQAQGLALHQHLQDSRLKLDAVRLVVTL